MSKKIEDQFKVLNHIDHILLRPQTYLGSNKPHTSTKWIYKEGHMVKQELTYVPSFLKIFDEIITNSVDEHKRNPNLNKIEIFLDRETGRITVKDNGGIPCVIHKEHNKYVPEVIFGNLMSGSNYDDSEDRVVAGTNGYGAKLTNVFSKEFAISTCDGTNQFYQVFSNNMRDRQEPKVKKSKKNHTEITYLPDYERFGLKGLDDAHYLLIQKRTIDIAGCNPDVKIFFNGEDIKIKSFEDYIQLYTKEYFYEQSKDKRWIYAIALSENGFQQVSFVNTTETYDGGTHVDYILNQVIGELRSYFLKKHKVDVKPSELKNHMFLFLNSTVVNPAFSSQTKEKLITEIKDFGSKQDVTNKIITQIIKSDIVNSILDWINQKKNAEENKALRELNKSLSKIKVDKLIDAKGKNRLKCSIAIFEGDSAISAFRNYRNPELMGAFALRGKFTNVSEMQTRKLVEDEQVVNLMGAIGLKLGHEVSIKDLRYGRILFYCDADVDGNSIVGLLINFFYKYWPDLFDRRMIYKVETPIIVATARKSNKKLSFYSLSEYNQWMEKINTKEWEINYKKGLATLTDDEYEAIISNPQMVLIKKDDNSKESLDIWFGKNSELRKNEMLK